MPGCTVKTIFTMEKEFDALCLLIRRGLWEQSGAENMTEPDFELDPDEWERLIRLAARVGIPGIAYDGLSSNHNARGLTKEQRIRWTLDVRQIEVRYQQQQRALLSLIRFFEGSGISVLLLRGQGISESYSIPAHREWRGLDIYLGDYYERGNRLIEAEKIAVKTEGARRSVFCWEGMPVGNHLHFLNVNGTQAGRKLERRLLQILEKQGADVMFVGGVQVRIPTPDFTALILVRQAIVRFLSTGVVLQNLCDLAVYFTMHAGRIDFEQLRHTLSDAGQFEVFSSFMEIARRRLGMPPVPGLWTEHKEEITQRIWADVSSPRSHLFTKNYLQMPVLKRKALGSVWLLRSKWKYDLTGPGVFGERVLLSIKALMPF